MKRIVWFLLIILGLTIAVGGCARWPDEPGPGPGETEYQLEMTLEVAGVINSSDGIYYIVIDADGNPATGPSSDILSWEDRFYYIKLEDGLFYFAQVEELSPELELTDSSYSENEIQVIIALSNLGDPEGSIDINVVTTDSDGYTAYDYLDDYFNINTVLYSTGEGISSNDLEDDEADFDIIKVTAKITTP